MGVSAGVGLCTRVWKAVVGTSGVNRGGHFGLYGYGAALLNGPHACPF